MKRITLATGILTAVMGLGLFGVSHTFAKEPSNNDNPMTSLVQRIADKFGLDQTEVQAVFDEARQEQSDKMKADFESKLSRLVTDGKITEAQKQLIIEKRSELESARQTEKDTLKNLSDEERKAKIDEERQALTSWSEETGINLEYLFSGHGPKGFGMRDHGTGSEKTNQ